MIKVVIQTIGTRHPGAFDLIGDSMVFDLSEKLRNPHDDPAMRYRTGLDQEVRDHVLNTSGAMKIVADIAEKAKAQLDGYADPRHRLVRVTVACRGGRHRSVAVAEEAAEYLRVDGIGVETDHRHIKLPVIDS